MLLTDENFMKSDKNAIMWFLIILLALLLSGLGIVYLSKSLCRFIVRLSLFGGAKPFLISLGTVLVLLGVLWWRLGAVNAVVCFLHLLLIRLLCDGLALLFGGGTRREIAGIAAIVGTLIWLSFAYYNAHTVRRTAYELSDAVSRPFRVVGFSDSHIGALFPGAELSGYVERLNAENADIAVIVGDFVDDDTSLSDMEAACAALGKLKTKYGVFYVFGNHDEGYFSNSKRGYGKAELTDCLHANGVTVLEDETVHLTENIRLCGRKDARYADRLSAEKLTEGMREDYIILLDHEPTDYTAESSAGAGLVLSGHTHGGQFLPIRKLIKILGKNDLLYGHEQRGETDFIVSSGIADWAICFKTGCISEYFVVDITPRKFMAYLQIKACPFCRNVVSCIM